jgi:hypothetical protein
VPQRFFTRFPKNINRVKLLDNRDRNRINSEIQPGYQKRPFLTHLSPPAAARNLFTPARLRVRSGREMSNEIGLRMRCDQAFGGCIMSMSAFNWR